MLRLSRPTHINESLCKVQFGLGRQHESNNNHAEAIKCFDLAALNGHPLACVIMANYFKEGIHVPKDPYAMIAWYNKAYECGYSLYPQTIINQFLIFFCEDPRYNPGKNRFSNEAIKKLHGGICVGLTARLLAAAYIGKNSSALTKNHPTVSESEAIRDDLNQFHLQLQTIVNWDGKRHLTTLEQKHFYSFLYTTAGYQRRIDTDNISAHQLDSLILLDSDETNSFKRELGCTFCVTEDQFANKLDALRQPNRMIIITVPGHMMGVFENYFFGPNNYKKDEQYVDSHEMTTAIFEEIYTIPNYPTDQPITISINIFVHHSEATPAHYQSYSELMAGSTSGNQGDPFNQCTALHMAVEHGHTESVKYFLEQKECDVNAKNCYGLTALHRAAYYNQIECVKLLLADQRCEIDLRNNAEFTPFQLAVYHGRIECVKLFIAHQ